MKVKIKIFATLKDSLGWSEKTINMKDDSTFLELLEEIPKLKEKIMKKNLEIHEHYRVFINGRYIEFAGGLNRVLNDGDEIAVFPAIAGGTYAEP
jgi:MoaD family protein